MTALWKREPLVILGVIASIIVLIAQQALANDLVSSTGAINALHFIEGVVPAILAVIARTQVSPAN